MRNGINEAPSLYLKAFLSTLHLAMCILSTVFWAGPAFSHSFRPNCQKFSRILLRLGVAYGRVIHMTTPT